VWRLLSSTISAPVIAPRSVLIAIGPTSLQTVPRRGWGICRGVSDYTTADNAAVDEGVVRDSRRWVVLAVGLVAMVTGCAAQYGYAYLLPALRAAGFSLTDAAALISAPILGVTSGLIAWGWAADRWGERIVLVSGLASAGMALIGAALADGLLALWVLLFATGATTAAIHAASGRLILGWFAASQRGLAMGIRQTGLPLGIGLAALTLPPLATAGVDDAFLFLAGGCLASAVLVALFVRNPVRPPALPGAPRPASPYRAPFLWRIHAASGLLVIPQYAVAAFGFDYLVSVRSWGIGPAGVLLAASQLAGAGARPLAGWWSDRVRSRLGPMRLLAVGIGLTMAVLAIGVFTGADLAVPALVAAAIITVSPNGLAYTAVAERAGSRWAGRALGIQNTVQNLIGSGVPPAIALAIMISGEAATGYALAFGAAVAFPFIAALAIPVRDEPRSGAWS
jgi:sugar phosphate permease